MDDNRSRKAVALLVVVFVLGLALGALGSYLLAARMRAQAAQSRGHHDHGKLVEQLTQELALSPEQQKQLGAILEDMRPKFQAIYEQVRPQYEAAHEEGRNRIRAILTPEQRPKFEEFVRRLDEQRKKKYGH